MLELPLELTQNNASACYRALNADLKSQPDVVQVNAAALGRFDSAALALLLSLRRQALALGKGFAVVGLPPRLADLARLYGIDALLQNSKG